MPETPFDMFPSTGDAIASYGYEMQQGKKILSLEIKSVEMLLSGSVIPTAVFLTSWSMALALWYPSKCVFSKTTN